MSLYNRNTSTSNVFITFVMYKYCQKVFKPPQNLKNYVPHFFNQMTIDDNWLNDMIHEKRLIIYNLREQSEYPLPLGYTTASVWSSWANILCHSLSCHYKLGNQHCSKCLCSFLSFIAYPAFLFSCHWRVFGSVSCLVWSVLKYQSYSWSHVHVGQGATPIRYNMHDHVILSITVLSWSVYSCRFHSTQFFSDGCQGEKNQPRVTWLEADGRMLGSTCNCHDCCSCLQDLGTHRSLVGSQSFYSPQYCWALLNI